VWTVLGLGIVQVLCESARAALGGRRSLAVEVTDTGGTVMIA